IPRLSRINSWIGQPWPLNKTKFFLRGKMNFQTLPPFEIQTLDLTLHDFHPIRIQEKLRTKVDEIKPHHVFIADAWYFKPYLICALSDYKPVVRLYVHEMTCIKGNGILFRDHQICPLNFLDGKLKTQKTCSSCVSKFYISYPSPRWIMEFIRSKGYSR